MPSLSSLNPTFRPFAEAFFKWAQGEVGGGLVVTSARRTRFEQARLYQAYLRGENNGLPAMPPGTSDHEVGLAFDMARPNLPAISDPALPMLGAAWLRYGGRWNARDPVHFAAPAGWVTRGRRSRAVGNRGRASSRARAHRRR